MNTEALSLLQSLLQEDDEIVEVSYLCGWCYYLLGEEPDENGKIDETVRKEAWEDARLCFINVENVSFIYLFIYLLLKFYSTF